ncbi:MAG: AMP-binding protein [Caulobacteraceae bacterium]
MANLLFEALFAGDPGAPALAAGPRTWTYADLLRLTARWADALVGLGVRPGDRIAVQVGKSAANLLLYLASLRAGAIFLPLNPAYGSAELGYFIADAEPGLVVCDPARREIVAAIAGGVRVEGLDGEGKGSMADLAARGSDRFETAPRGPDDLAAICYTSGTTGRSKGAMLSHHNLLANARTLKDLWAFSERDVLIHALPLFHVHGLFVANHVLMLAGGVVVLQPRFEADAVVAAMPGATAMMGVPTFYTRLLTHEGLTRETAANMRLFISGSAPLPPRTHAAWLERTGHAIVERYGLTETGMNASNPYDGERRAGTVGRALPGVSLRIVEEASGAPLATGGAGMIEVRGPNVFRGYWRDRRKTAEAFRKDGFFITGDLGRIDDDGYLSIVGRAKDLVICGGLNVYPKEVEALIDALPGVAESAVIGLPHPDLGEAVTAVVVAAPGAGLEEAAILAALAPELARFKRPRRILFEGELPRNAMGKVQKAVLRERHGGLYDRSPLASGRLEQAGKTST